MSTDPRPTGTRTRAAARTAAAPDPAVFRRRRIVVASLAGALVLAIALVTAFLWPGFAVPEPLPTPTITETAPPPEPTIDPVARAGEQTDLTHAVPQTAREFVEQSFANYPTWQDENKAIESWTFTYADAEGADATTITLVVGQWADADAAKSFHDAQVRAAGSTIRDGQVKVGSDVVGTYAISGTADAAVMWWRNGTVVMRAEGPQEALETFYTHFPL